MIMVRILSSQGSSVDVSGLHYTLRAIAGIGPQRLAQELETGRGEAISRPFA